MPTTSSGIWYADNTLADGTSNLKYLFAPGESRVERWIQMRAQGQLPQFVRDFLGYAEPLTNGTQTYIHRVLPEPFQDFTTQVGIYWLWANAIFQGDAVSFEEPNPGVNTPRYNTIRLWVAYTSRTYDVLPDSDLSLYFQPHPGYSSEIPPVPAQSNPLAGLPDEATLRRFVTKVPGAWNRAITIPRALMRWVFETGDNTFGKPAGPYVFEGTSKLESGLLLEYIHHLRPDVPTATILATMGCLNAYKFDGHERGTLICEAPQIRPQRSPLGEFTYDIHFRFRQVTKQKLDGTLATHNHFLRVVPRTTGTTPVLDYRLMTTTGTSSGTRTLPYADFHKLFRPDQP